MHPYGLFVLAFLILELVAIDGSVVKERHQKKIVKVPKNGTMLKVSKRETREKGKNCNTLPSTLLSSLSKTKEGNKKRRSQAFLGKGTGNKTINYKIPSTSSHSSNSDSRISFSSRGNKRPRDNSSTSSSKPSSKQSSRSSSEIVKSKKGSNQKFRKLKKNRKNNNKNNNKNKIHGKIVKKLGGINNKYASPIMYSSDMQKNENGFGKNKFDYNLPKATFNDISNGNCRYEDFTFDLKEDLIGSGGFGRVYKAWHGHSKKWYAIKSSIRKDDEELLMRELEIQSSINLAAIAKAYCSMKDSEGLTFIVIEYVKGECLDEYSRSFKDSKVPIKKTIDIFNQLLMALHELHKLGIMHRDVSPGNIMVQSNGAVKLIDFGLAINEATDSAYVGTDGYAAPELIQVKWKRKSVYTAATDYYSLGAVVYRLLVGKHPLKNHFIQAYKIRDKKLRKRVITLIDSDPKRRWENCFNNYKQLKMKQT